MISILQVPESISLSKNPILLQVRATDSGGNLYRATGVQSIIESTGDWGIVEDEAVWVQWTDENGIASQTLFTAKDAPSDNPLLLQIPADPSGYGSLLEYYQDIADRMQKSYQVGPYISFSATYDGSKYYLIAEQKIVSDEVTVNFDTSLIISAPNFTKTNNTTSSPYNLPDNHRVICEVYFESIYESSNYEKVATLDTQIDEDGIAVFDVHDILDVEGRDSLLDPAIPEFNSSTPEIADNTRRYFLRYREDYDGISTPEWSLAGIYKVIIGGIDQVLFAQYDFFDSLGQANSLLTWYPSGKTVDATQPEYLAWFNYTSEEKTVCLYADFYDHAGMLLGSVHYDTNSIVVSVNETALIPAGLDQIDTSSIVGDIAKYVVKVVDQADELAAYSQQRIFFVDYCHYREKRYIQYLNSFSVPETIRCLGDLDIDLEVAREISKRILTPNYEQTFAQNFQYRHEHVNGRTYRSGYLRREEAEALQELLIYNHLYEVNDSEQVRLLILDNRYAITTTRQFLHSIEFRARRSTDPVSYSNDYIDLIAATPGYLLDDTGVPIADDDGTKMLG